MPFGEYPERKCANPKCGGRFKPTTPWQGSCSDKCRDHCTYLRTVIPKRLKAMEARLAGLRRRKDADPERIRRIEERLGEKRRRARETLAQLRG